MVHNEFRIHTHPVNTLPHNTDGQRNYRNGHRTRHDWSSVSKLKKFGKGNIERKKNPQPTNNEFFITVKI